MSARNGQTFKTNINHETLKIIIIIIIIIIINNNFGVGHLQQTGLMTDSW